MGNITKALDAQKSSSLLSIPLSVLLRGSLRLNLESQNQAASFGALESANTLISDPKNSAKQLEGLNLLQELVRENPTVKESALKEGKIISLISFLIDCLHYFVSANVHLRFSFGRRLWNYRARSFSRPETVDWIRPETLQSKSQACELDPVRSEVFKAYLWVPNYAFYDHALDWRGRVPTKALCLLVRQLYKGILVISASKRGDQNIRIKVYHNFAFKFCVFPKLWMSLGFISSIF